MSDKFLPDDPRDFAQFFRKRADGHAPGFDLAVYARPHQWMAVAKMLENADAVVLQDKASIADQVVSLAEDGLRRIDRTIAAWPAEFRVIIWEAVADIATRRSNDARPVPRPHRD